MRFLRFSRGFPVFFVEDFPVLRFSRVRFNFISLGLNPFGGETISLFTGAKTKSLSDSKCTPGQSVEWPLVVKS